MCVPGGAIAALIAGAASVALLELSADRSPSTARSEIRDRRRCAIAVNLPGRGKWAPLEFYERMRAAGARARSHPGVLDGGDE